MDITERAKKIRPFYVMESLEKARILEARGKDIVHMEVGEPDFPTPWIVKEAAVKAIKENRTFYTHSLGLLKLRERIAQYYAEKIGLSISPERIVVTEGSSGAFFLLSLALLESGKIMAVSDPGYPCYRNFGYLTDADVLPIPVSEDADYEITSDSIIKMGIPSLLIIANPSNPVGNIYRKERLDELHALLKGKGILVIDEVYSGLVYEGEMETALSISDDIIVVNGFSKTFAMTGWRLGWMIIPMDLVRPIQKIAQNVFISPPTISQHAALKVFDAEDELEAMRQTYKTRRDFLVSALRRLGFHIPYNPKGAFYIYAGIERWDMDSREFADRALTEAGVALTPGYDFGAYKASSHVRFSYAQEMPRLREGCNRLERWLRDNT